MGHKNQFNAYGRPDGHRAEILKIRGLGSEHQNGYWSEEDRKKLEDMFYDGVGISEMAVIFQRSEGAIVNQLRHLKVFRVNRRHRCKNENCKCPSCSLRDKCTKKSPVQQES